MKRLYFIRHGESVANAKELFAGRWDTPLTKLGRDQAKEAAQAVKSLEIDCIVSSPLIRARKTAEIIADEIGYPKNKILFSDLFMERDYGDLQAKPFKAADKIDFEKVPNIEPQFDVIKRAKEAASYLNRLQANNVLVIGHGTHGRALHQEVLNLVPAQIEVPIQQEIPNAKVVRWI